MSEPGCSLERPHVKRLLARLHSAAKRDLLKGLLEAPAFVAGLARGKSVSDILLSGAGREMYLPVSSEQGRMLYLAARTIGARRVVEYGTSFGISTLYLAAAVIDNGGGQVVGSELERTKHRVAVANLAEAGFSETAEVRLGDAMQTLRDVPAPVDLVLLDGSKDFYLPMLEMLTPKLRPGAVVFADNIFTFKKALRPYVEYVQSGRHGFRSTTLRIADGFEYSFFEGGDRRIAPDA